MPAPAPVPTITCPNCRQTLPVRAMVCQFCKTDVSKIARPVVAGQAPAAIADTDWKVVAYYVMSGWWMFNGIVMILGAVVFHNKLMEGGFGTVPIIVLIIGTVYALTGLGLACRVELARGIVNILSWLTVAGSVMRIAGFLMAGLVMGPVVIFMILRALFDGLLAGFQIYLIGETDNFMR
jgi:hypothetical protein